MSALLPFAVECQMGFVSVLSRGPKGVRAMVWMLPWFVIYDSDGNVVGERKAKPKQAAPYPEVNPYSRTGCDCPSCQAMVRLS